MLGFKLNHVSKRGYWCQESRHDEYGRIYYINAPLHDTYNHNKTKQNRTVVISYELAYTIILLALREKKTNNVLVFDYGDATMNVKESHFTGLSTVYSKTYPNQPQTNHQSWALMSLWPSPAQSASTAYHWMVVSVNTFFRWILWKHIYGFAFYFILGIK